MEVEKEQITGKLVFFGEFGVGKGLQFFFIFLSKVLAAGELCAIIKQHAEQFVLLHKMN